jgi:hypothetical protein
LSCTAQEGEKSAAVASESEKVTAGEAPLWTEGLEFTINSNSQTMPLVTLAIYHSPCPLHNGDTRLTMSVFMRREKVHCWFESAIMYSEVTVRYSEVSSDKGWLIGPRGGSDVASREHHSSDLQVKSRILIKCIQAPLFIHVVRPSENINIASDRETSTGDLGHARVVHDAVIQ